MNSSACSGGGLGRWRKKLGRAGRLAGLFALGGLIAGSGTASPLSDIFRRASRPDNVFAYPAKLSLDFRRVAVLPLAAADTGDLPAGCEALAPVLRAQLVATKKFEVAAVDADGLRRRTGRAAWTGGEVLPPDFLAYLRREYDCDGVLFAELTTYRAYAPMAIGWRFKLVDTRTGQVLWAADELFDAAQPAVAKAARRFAGEKPVWPLLDGGDDWSAQNSPRQFGGYSAAALLATLPER